MMSQFLQDLAARAEAGDAEAMASWGRVLVTGDGVPITMESLQRGLALLRDASAAGAGEAAAVLATVSAFGILQPRDFGAALTLLRTAAGRGWSQAQSQLAVIEASLDRSPGPGTLLHDKPRLRVFENFASDAECDWLIEKARGNLQRAEVYQAAAHVEQHEIRTNSESYLMPRLLDVVTASVLQRIAKTVRADLTFCEFATVLHYEPGQRFGPHADYFDPNNPGRRAELLARGQRIVTFLVYLSDDYDGGETEFLDAGIKYKGRKGDALLFLNVDASGAPDYTTRHQGSAPTRGEKWVLSQWVRSHAINPYLTPGGEKMRLPQTWLEDAWRA